MPLAAHRLKWRTRHFFNKNVHGPIVAETVRRKDSSANVGHSCRILFWRTRHRFSPTVQHCCGCSTSPLTHEGNPVFALQVSELGIILCGIIMLSFGFVVRWIFTSTSSVSSAARETPFEKSARAPLEAECSQRRMRKIVEAGFTPYPEKALVSQDCTGHRPRREKVISRVSIWTLLTRKYIDQDALAHQRRPRGFSRDLMPSLASSFSWAPSGNVVLFAGRLFQRNTHLSRRGGVRT